MHAPRFALVLLSASLALATTLGAQPPTPAATASAAPTPAPTPTRFTLDFPGGTARELADAISKASGKPCNIVASGAVSSLRLPAVRVTNASLPELLTSMVTSAYQFTPHAFGRTGVDDNTVWALRMNMNSESEGRTFCRFYTLAPFIDAGLSADDITTTLTTAWTLLGMEKPKLSFHQETKLLIAVGAHEQLTVIESALAALSPPNAKANAPTGTPAPAKK